MNFNFLQWFDTTILTLVVLSFFINFLIAYLWHKKLYKKLGLKPYKAIQRIHLNETPRLGGLIFILSLFSLVLYSSNNESIFYLKLILICLIPIIITGLKEDFFHNVDPAVRLISILFAGWLFTAKLTGPLPDISEIPLVSKFLILQGGASFFYIISMATIANGMNMCDGVNGLCGSIFLSILGALLFLSYKTADVVMLPLILNLILFFIPFMLINYPYGRIFLGDLGAYSIGLIVSMLTIIFFSRHPEITPWLGAFILIYPATEIFFSLFRRILKGKNVMHPDTGHLHLKIFNFLRLKPAYTKISNALVTPLLSALWLFPLIAIPWIYQKKFFILSEIVLFIIFYGAIYVFFSKAEKKLNVYKK
jgi:UDP-N-acetylmuramyl pentapeptide phosphotransferase/UDP-N-acetylglucosamine-1-phosphate transferase